VDVWEHPVVTAPPSVVAHVASLHRYPVKSLAGEPLARVHVGPRGLDGDRTWAVRGPDGKLGSGKSTRRFRRMDGLLDLLATTGDDGRPVVRLPDGRTMVAGDPALDAALSAHVGRPVALAREADVPHHDEGPLHVLTTASLDAVSAAHGRPAPAARFRPNLVLETTAGDGYVEDAWVGREVEVGDELVLHVRDVMPRCVMVTLPQHDLAADAELLRTVTRAHGSTVGVVADVVRPGVVAVGDAVRMR